MNWRTRTRENAGHSAELRPEHRNTDSDVAFHKEWERLEEVLRFLRTEIGTTRETVRKTAASRLKIRATRETIAAKLQTSEHLWQSLKSVQAQVHSPQQLRPGVKAVEHGSSVNEQSSPLALHPAVAHEINNPLEAIVGLIYLLENEATR